MPAWLLEIGGTRIILKAGDGDGPPWAGHCRDFVSALPGEVAEADLLIRVRDGKPDEWATRPDAVTFSSQSWSCLRTERGYVFRQGTDLADPFAVATVDGAFRVIDVQLGDPTRPGWRSLRAVLHHLLRVFFMYFLLRRERGLILHAAGVLVDEGVYVFPGRSGAGKSTVARLFLSQAGSQVLSDDRIVGMEDSGSFSAWGTPWPGDLGVAVNRDGPLKGLFFLHKSERTEVREISPRRALDQLLPVVSIPWYDPDLVACGLDLCGRLLARTPLYELHFRPDRSAVDAVLSLAG